MEQDVFVSTTVLTAPGTVVLNCQGASTASVNLNSISSPSGFSYTIEGSIDGSDYFAVSAYDPTTIGTFFHGAQTATTGQWVVPCAGLQKVRFNLTAIAAGDAIIDMRASVAAGAIYIAGGAVALAPSFVKLLAATTGGVNVTNVAVANDVLSHVVKASAGQLYGISTFNNNSSPAYVKIYDATTATAGSGTPVERIGIPAGAHNIEFPVGLSFGSGITAIVSGGIGDGDTTAPAASTFLVSFYWR